MEKKLLVFTDGSVNTKTKIGFGAYLIIDEEESNLDIFKKKVKLKRFEGTSSTKLELQILLYVLKEVELLKRKIIFFTDSQNIISLQRRREKLEKNDYYSKKGIRINNFELYKEFYKLTSKLNCEFVKVKGHQSKFKKSEIEKIFTLVDRTSRNALRNNS